MKLNACILTVLFSLICSPKLWAAIGVDDWSLGGGTLTQFVGHIQTNTEGDKNTFEFTPFLQASAFWDLEKNSPGGWQILADVGVVLPKSGRDELITKWGYFTSAGVAFSSGDFSLLALLGLSMTVIEADGGEQRLRNGNDFSSFPMPNGMTTTRNVVVDLGAQYRFLDDWSARVDLITFNPTDSLSRAFSYHLAFNYHFGDWHWDN